MAQNYAIQSAYHYTEPTSGKLEGALRLVDGSPPPHSLCKAGSATK